MSLTFFLFFSIAIQVQAKFEVLYEDRFTDEMSDAQFQETVSEFRDIINSDELFADANSEAEKIIVSIYHCMSKIDKYFICQGSSFELKLLIQSVDKYKIVMKFW